MNPVDWILMVTGIQIPQGEYSVYYNFWSGFGSILERLIEVLVIGGLLYHRHNCHVHGCLRIGKYSIENTPYVVCKKHHPTAPLRITAEHIQNRSKKNV